MPELPEVETIACDLRARGLPGSRVEGVRIYRPLVVRSGAEELARRLPGRRVESVGRHGKLLIVNLDRGLGGGASLIVHLKMTGQVILTPAAEPLLKHTHVVIELEGGRELRFRDVRRFGYLSLVDEAGLEAALSSLGPDVLAVSEEGFAALLSARRSLLKPLLTDQTALAGLGNIYSNEMLFAARLNPWRRSSEVSRAEARRLYRAMVRVLRGAIRCRGSSTSDFVDTAGRAGEFQRRHRVYRKPVCPRCQGKIVREVRGGRSAFWCPKCQPAAP